MITSNLMGGIGNQMFEISAAYALALRNNDVCFFDLDKCYTPGQGFTSNKYSNNILSKVPKSSQLNIQYQYNEGQSFCYKEIPYTPNLLLNGYFQSENYFHDYKQEIYDLIYISETDKEFIREVLELKNKKITTVHIRRGDYLKYPDIHTLPNINYYTKAIEMVGHNSNHLFVFLSDDIDWVKENFVGDDFVYSKFKNNEILDFTLLSMASNSIIANSSFSWWGAWLAEMNRNDGKVIAPMRWFGPKGPQDYYDIIPERWIKIE